MDCEYVKTEAGSDEWLGLRRGRLTASHAGDWLANPKTKRYQDYLELKTLELLGHEEEEQEAPWFHHGKAMEPYARGAYEFKTGIETDNNVILIHKDYDWLAASPDGVWLPNLDGMIEVKCREELDTYTRKLNEQRRTNKIESVYRPQVQCQMLVSGLDMIDFVNYYHDQEQRVRKMHVFPVLRDDDLINKIEVKALEFMTECYKRAQMRAPASLR